MLLQQNVQIMKHRRQFLISTSAFLALPSIQPLLAQSEKHSTHHPAEKITGPQIPLPAGTRNPFGWETIGITDNPILLRWENTSACKNASALRITLGFDDRTNNLIEVTLAKTGTRIATFDIRYGCIFQVYEIPLAPGVAGEIASQGIHLKLVKGNSLRIFTHGSSMPDEFKPHLLVTATTSPFEEFFKRMNSFACIQSFSWQGGCVLDGLLDLSALEKYQHLRDSAKRQISKYIQDGKLIYENHVSKISDGKVYGIEGLLPFAALAHIDPQNPALELALQFCARHTKEDGSILDGTHVSSEGCYTVGYPLAVIGLARNDQALQLSALTQLRTRQSLLFDGDTFHRTLDPVEGGGVKMGNRNWGRGIAWQLLGYARVLRTLKHRSDLADLTTDFQQLCAWTASFQQKDGLWSVFVDEPKLTQDTAGSAGIAAAFAIGAREGWLEESYLTKAAATLRGLKAHLTPDGFLGGVAQANKGGEALQRGNYRVIYQMAMGLTAQLIAALES